MILSSLLTPFRIYSEPSDLDKFKRDCDKFAPFELITDKTRLLPFQFMRTHSPYPISNIWLRQECKSFYTNLLSHNVSKFIDVSPWSTTPSADVQGGRAKLTTGASGYIKDSFLLTVGNTYKIKVIVTEKKYTSGIFTADVYNGVQPIGSINGAGTYIFDWTALYTSFDIKFNIGTTGDYLIIDEVQVSEVSGFMNESNDFELDTSLLQYKVAASHDIIFHCGSTLTNTLPCGSYYIIMQSKDAAGNDEYYFSEIITIKNFIPTQSPYIFLEWTNTCDIQNVKYTGSDCSYKNRLYIDGPLAKPDYPFKEEVEKDGYEKENPTFQKWEKTVILTNPKSPEFIVDALTAMRIHDTIKFYPALRKNEEQINISTGYFEVLSLTFDVNYIFSDCAANVDLKLLLDESVIDTTCCTPIATVNKCFPCTFLLEGLCIDSENVKICPAEGGGYDYFIREGEVYVPADPSFGTLICFGDGTPSLYFNGSEWVHIPLLSALTNAALTITVTGTIFSGSVGQIIISNFTTTYVVPGYYSAAQLAAGVVLNKSDLPAEFFETYMDVTIHNVSTGCDYGYSNVLSLSYGEGG